MHKLLFIIVFLLINNIHCQAKPNTIESITEIDKIHDNDVYINFQYKNDILYGLRFNENTDQSEVWILDEHNEKTELVLDGIPGIAYAFLIRDNDYLIYYHPLLASNETYYLSKFNKDGSETLLSVSKEYNVDTIIDLNGLILYGNNLQRSYFGYSEDEIPPYIFSYENSQWVFTNTKICYSKYPIDTIKIGEPLIECFDTETQVKEIILSKTNEIESIKSIVLSQNQRYLYFSNQKFNEQMNQIETRIFRIDLNNQSPEIQLVTTIPDSISYSFMINDEYLFSISRYPQKLDIFSLKDTAKKTSITLKRFKGYSIDFLPYVIFHSNSLILRYTYNFKHTHRIPAVSLYRWINIKLRKDS